MKSISGILKSSAIFMMTVVILCTAVIGCEKGLQEPTQPGTTGQAEFFLLDSCLKVPASGGNVKVVYMLRNAADKYAILPESDAGWFGPFDIGDRTIDFSIDPNPDDSVREAQICFTYTAENDTVSDILTVTQRGTEVVPEFEFDVNDATDYSVSFSVIPKDKDMPYIAMITEKSFFDSFDTDGQFLENELMVFALQAESQGLSLEEYLGLRLFTGDTDSVEVTGLEPETEYCIYAHGMDVKGNILTDLYKDYVSTGTAGFVDIDFEITADILGTDVTLCIEPSDLEQKYVFDAFKTGTIPDGYPLEESFQEYIDGLIELYARFGIGTESAVAQISRTGKATSKAELDALTDYVCMAASINDIGTVNSSVVYKYFTTGEVLPSDNIIGIDITEVEERSAAISFIPSNDDPYIFIVDKAERWKNLTEDELSEKLLSAAGASPDRFTGEHDEVAGNLMPETGYVVIACGWVQGVLTTAPFIEYFTTGEASVSDVTFKLLYDKYFDCDELSSVYSGYSGLSGFVAVPAEAEITGDVSNYLYHIFRGDMMDEEVWPDSRAIDTLIGRNISNKPEIVFFATYDVGYTFLGVAIDNEGNYGKVFRGRFLPVREGVSPVEEFGK